MFKAITVRQPHAARIAAGEKLVENRGHVANWRGEVAIHAGRTPDLTEGMPFCVAGDPLAPLLAVRGAVLAVAELVDCHPADGCCGPYAVDVYNDKPAHHLVLADARVLPEPVPCRGQLQVGWVLPDHVEWMVREQLAEVAR